MFIVRYSEIGLKGEKARQRMEQLLMRNIKKGLDKAGATAEVKKGFGRIYILEESDGKSVSDVLSRTMGVKTFSRSVVYRFTTLSDISERAVELWSGSVAGKSFAVRARRTGQHDFGSRDIMRVIGDALMHYADHVDLETPEVELSIEVRENRAYFFTETENGPGGLPLGSEGKLVALVSGGIDSPVAAWSVMKRGCPTDLVFCSLAPPVDTVDFLRAAGTLVERWGHGYDPKIHILDGTGLVQALTDRERFKLSNITFKRILYLVAQEIAEMSSAHGIVTGESLGQVSSQTPESLHATAHNMSVPVMRPLLGYDKDEIVEVARRIGTFPSSSTGEFCSLFAAQPITRPTVDELEEDMRNFNFLDEILESRKVIRGSEISHYMDEIKGEKLELSTLPPNSLVVDLRAKEKFDEWHYPGASNTSLNSIEEIAAENRGKPIIFYCTKGLQSAYAASRARSMGADAYYISTGKLKKSLEAN